MLPVLALVLAAGLVAIVGACSSDTGTTPAGSDGGDAAADAAPPTVSIVTPASGSTHELNADEVDIELKVEVTGFTLVPLGEEGDDPRKGQVRIFVNEHDCDDPGDETEPAVEYNRILPNEENESTIGMDYCVGGVDALIDKTHALKAQLFHGETPLSVTATTAFKTTFDFRDAGADAADATTD